MLKSWSLEWEPNQTRNPCKQTIIVFNFIKKNKCHSKAIVDTSDTRTWHFQYLAEVSKCGGDGLSVKLTTSRPPSWLNDSVWLDGRKYLNIQFILSWIILSLEIVGTKIRRCFLCGECSYNFLQWYFLQMQLLSHFLHRAWAICLELWQN